MSHPPPSLAAVIATDDLLEYVDAALDGMAAIVTDLGDELANCRPELDGANSPYVILTHCLGVMEFWGGEAIAGRAITRDRDAEFRASGPVAELVGRIEPAKARLRADLADLDGAVPLHLPQARTKGGAAVHILEELAQHHGQMELTRDVLRA